MYINLCATCAMVNPALGVGISFDAIDVVIVVVVVVEVIVRRYSDLS